MNGEFPVDAATRRFFFDKRLSETVGIEYVHEPSSFASLDARAAERRISAFQNDCFTLSFPNCGTCCPSVRRAHWRTLLPDRSPSGRSGSMARLHRSDPRRADRADAVLRTDTSRSGEKPERLAHARARAPRKSRICLISHTSFVHASRRRGRYRISSLAQYSCRAP